LLQQGIAACQDAYPNSGIRIAAQQYLEKFYQSFGFITVSDMYLEDDIPHIDMLLSVTPSN
jgi:ElaA protein